jgi:hypothetical protein
MVEYLEHGLSFHVAQELKCQEDDATILERLERAFLMADIHSKQLGITTSGATVAVCLVQVSEACEKGNGINMKMNSKRAVECGTPLLYVILLYLTTKHPVHCKCRSANWSKPFDCTAPTRGMLVSFWDIKDKRPA